MNTNKTEFEEHVCSICRKTYTVVKGFDKGYCQSWRCTAELDRRKYQPAIGETEVEYKVRLTKQASEDVKALYDGDKKL
jgi:hypothetical protein